MENKNVHVLPTTQDSWLCLKDGELINANDGGCMLGYDPPRWLTQHIYITNDEEIKEGDWVKLFVKHIDKEWIHKITKEDLLLYTDFNNEGAKIILTTDQDLIKDGVQAIDDEFLEWFVKNPTCEWVTITELNDLSKNKYRIYNYKEAIPKEEYKKQTIEGILETLDTKQLGELNIFLKGVERKEAQNKELYDDLVDLLERLRPIYKEVTDLHWKYEQKRLDLIELLKKK